MKPLTKRDWQPGTAVLMATGKDRYSNGLHEITARKILDRIELTGCLGRWFETTKTINTLDMNAHDLEAVLLYTLCEMFEILGSKAETQLEGFEP